MLHALPPPKKKQTKKQQQQKTNKQNKTKTAGSLAQFYVS